MDALVPRPWYARTPLRYVDPVLIAVTVALSVFGLFMVFSATHKSLAALDLDTGLFLKRQVAWLLLGVVALAVTVTFDYRLAKVYAGFIYGGILVLLLLVWTPLGSARGGAQRWFELFGFQLTPSEYMKLGLAVMLAAYLSELRTSELSLRDLWRAAAIAALPILLVFLQPDVGTTIVLTAILVGTVIVAGARPRHLGVLALCAGILLFGAFQLGVVREYQVERLTAFLDPSDDPLRAGYNKQQAEIAIGAGGITGVGYLRGTQTNLDFVPEQHTDFVFTVVGEELGFVGSVLLLSAFGILLWRGFRIALASRDPFGTYVAAGITSMLAVQVFVNIGMTVGIMPITGIPLPFVSYGGSSLLASYIAVGLLLNVHMRRFK